MLIREFPTSVIERIGYYVYALIDPENEQVFYIGKGTGNRVFAHASAALAEVSPIERLDRIRTILAKGLEVTHLIIRHGLTEKEAFEVEAALIDFVGIEKLTNQVHGFSSDDRGKMSVADIIEKYAAPEVQITEPAILITLNQQYRKGMGERELYEKTRGDWVIGVKRDRAKYAFAVYHGIIREVYEIETWSPSPNASTLPTGRRRWRFEGKIAYELRHYVGGSVARYSVLGAQNPIRYINI